MNKTKQKTKFLKRKKIMKKRLNFFENKKNPRFEKSNFDQNNFFQQVKALKKKEKEKSIKQIKNKRIKIKTNKKVNFLGSLFSKDTNVKNGKTILENMNKSIRQRIIVSIIKIQKQNDFLENDDLLDFKSKVESTEGQQFRLLDQRQLLSSCNISYALKISIKLCLTERLARILNTLQSGKKKFGNNFRLFGD